MPGSDLREGPSDQRPLEIPSDDAIVGRWAGDRVVLIGDYDESKFWYTSETFRNISREVALVWNEFIEILGKKLTYNPACSCQDDSD